MISRLSVIFGSDNDLHLLLRLSSHPIGNEASVAKMEGGCGIKSARLGMLRSKLS